LSALGKNISICVSSPIVMKVKKPTYCIGKSPVKRSVHRKNGNGGFSMRGILGTTRSYILNEHGN
jgi:hypothetical protein